MSFSLSASPGRRTWLGRVLYGPRELRAGFRFAIFALLFEVGILTFGAGAKALHGASDGLSAALERKCINAATVILATYAMAKLEGRKFSAYGLPWGRAFGARFWQGAIAAALALALLLAALGAAGAFHLRGVALAPGAALGWGVFYLLAFVVVALNEELLFRGYPLHTLSSGIGFWPAASGLSLLFGLAHLGNAGETWFGAINVVLGGLVMSDMLRRSGNLWLPIGAHVGWDWAQTYFFGVADSGNVLPGHLLETSSSGPAWLSGGSVGPEGSVLCSVVWIAGWLLVVRAFRGPARGALLEPPEGSSRRV